MNLLHAKEKLMAAKAELEARLERTHKHLHGKDAPVSPNFHEQVVETGNDQVVQALEQEGLHELRQITRALARLESGDYPYCSKCGTAIGEQRLTAIPYTEHCIKCA
jgi:RNA polymerase-binding protein DksA